MFAFQPDTHDSSFADIFKGFPEWRSSWSDGAETTGPASDAPATLSTCESSDDDSMETFSNKPHTRPFVPLSHVPVDSCNDATECDLAGALDNAFRGANKLEPLPAQDLVDLDPEEGRRRGNEIMAILQESSFSQAPTEGHKLNVNDEQREKTGRSSNNTVGAHSPPACLGRDAPTAWPRSVPHEQAYKAPGLRCAMSQSWPTKSLSWSDPCRGAVQAAIGQAASYMYGEYFAELSDGADGALVVRLDGSREQWQAWTVLDMLGGALAKLLGAQLAGWDHCVTSSRMNLTLQLFCEDGRRQGDECCWEFARRGTCSRGGQCRWRHVPQQTCLVDIEVIFSEV